MTPEFPYPDVLDLPDWDVSARRILINENIEDDGTPFAPSIAAKPLVDLLDGRRTHDDLTAEEIVRAIETTDGRVALYLCLSDDKEWWVAYDGQQWHLWTTYPGGPWEHTVNERGLMEHHLEELQRHRVIHRSKVVTVDEARHFVWETIREHRLDRDSEQQGTRANNSGSNR